MARKVFPWGASTLARVDQWASGVDKKHWLSGSGKMIENIVKLLIKGRGAEKPTPDQVVDKIVELGEARGWDMPNMDTALERRFLVWMVRTAMGL